MTYQDMSDEELPKEFNSQMRRMLALCPELLDGFCILATRFKAKGEEVERLTKTVDRLENAEGYEMSMSDLRDQFLLLREELAKVREERDGWHNVVDECNRILELTGVAADHLTANLPNVVRDNNLELTRLRAELKLLNR